MNQYNEKLAHINLHSLRILKNLPQLTYVGNAILRQKIESTEFDLAMNISKELIETLLAYPELTGFGRGLAAPQIGKAAAVFVTYVDGEMKTYINPKIISESKETNLYKESCISSHHLWCDVRRARDVTLHFTNEKNQQVSEHYEGFIARLIQHEYDHLLGIVNLDRAVPGTIDYCFGDPLQEKLRNI